MEKTINHLRNKSEEERRHLLHFFTILFAIILFLAWTYSLGHTFSDPETKAKLKEDVQPFQSLKENLSDGAQNSIDVSPISELQ